MHEEKICKNYNKKLDCCKSFCAGADGKCINKIDKTLCYYEGANSKLEDIVMSEIVKFKCPICGTMFSDKIVDYKICPHCNTLIQITVNKCGQCDEVLYEITFDSADKVFSKFYCEKCKKMIDL